MPETRIVLKNCEKIDPRDLKTYLAADGFKAWKRCQEELSPEEVIKEIKSSELLGRGGAGFSCGLKWELARKNEGEEKYLICNGDEGEVGAFKDRYILSWDPFSLIEGLAIAAYAIGAKKAYIYLRAEYHFLLNGLEQAIQQVEDGGFLNQSDIQIVEGAGAYICGEESALMESIEGKRGEARFKPPFPPIKGLFGRPTIINNVETLVNIPRIILKDADWFKTMGTEKSKGTKVFSVSGDVERPGVYELLMGSPLKELVVDLAGAQEVKAVQVGGASGRILPKALLDTPLAYEHVLGSGAVVVFNRHRDLIDIVHRNMEFLAEESCGKCTPCREGTYWMLQLYERLLRGKGVPADVDLLCSVARGIQGKCLCPLGEFSTSAVVSGLTRFRQDFDAQVEIPRERAAA